MLRIALVTLVLVGCKKPERDCGAVVEHFRTVSKATVGPTDETRVLAACKTWPQPAYDCLMAATDDAGITACQSKLK